jgi:hypothetical protein
MKIYKLTFPNGKVYIGQTKQNLMRRIYSHRYDAKIQRDISEYNPNGSKIGNAIRKYKNFEIELLEDNILTDSELDLKEIKYIEEFDSVSNGYNIQPGGNKNKKHTKETLMMISRASKDRWNNPEIASRMREGLRKSGLSQKGKMKKPRETRLCDYCSSKYRIIETSKRRFCSKTCAAKSASIIATKSNLEILNKKRYIQKNKILKWVSKNPEIVLNCPYNKIKTNLEILLKITNFKDWRTLTMIFNTKSRKIFLDKLKKHAKMYAKLD